MMNKKTHQKGFTVVELVIVIATIAILAAILIPTFVKLITKANLSADEIAVKNMNTALTAEFPLPSTFTAAKDALDKAGFNTKKNIIPTSRDYIFVWGEEEQAILLVKVTGETKEIVYPKKYIGVQYDSNKHFDLSLPGAKVLDTGDQEVKGLLANLSNFGQSEEYTCDLQCSYTFTFAEDKAAVQSSAYANWYADYVITFDKDVQSGIKLAGQYDSFFADWIIIDSENALETFGVPVLAANTRIRLLELVGMGFTYAEINEMMSEFHCGATDDGSNSGTTMTVELCLFNPADANDYKIVTVNEYTFK